MGVHAACARPTGPKVESRLNNSLQGALPSPAHSELARTRSHQKSPGRLQGRREHHESRLGCVQTQRGERKSRSPVRNADYVLSHFHMTAVRA